MMKAISKFTPSRTTEYVVCFKQQREHFRNANGIKTKCSVSQKNLCTTNKVDKKQNPEHVNFCFCLQMITLMFLPICVTAYTLQLRRPIRMSHICNLQLK